MTLLLLSVACVSENPADQLEAALGNQQEQQDALVFNRVIPESATFVVHFVGDLERYSHVMLTCIPGDPTSHHAAEFDDSGATKLYLADDVACPDPHFNVWDSFGGATDPEVLGIPGTDLFLDVDPPGSTFVPLTEDGSYYWEGGVPPYDTTLGWPYGVYGTTIPR